MLMIGTKSLVVTIGNYFLSLSMMKLNVQLMQVIAALAINAYILRPYLMKKAE